MLVSDGYVVGNGGPAGAWLVLQDGSLSEAGVSCARDPDGYCDPRDRQFGAVQFGGCWSCANAWMHASSRGVLFDIGL